MSDSDWYEVAEGGGLLQGDVLTGCPVFRLSEAMRWPMTIDSEMDVRAKVLDLVVMTQSCDLENNKVADVLLARLASWSEMVLYETEKGNQVVKSSKFRKLLVDGGVHSLSLLHKRVDPPTLPWSVVDFHHLFTLPKSFLVPFAASLGLRLRLRSPYREHLAQAFARYFMRVGLPHDAKGFEKEGDVKV